MRKTKVYRPRRGLRFSNGRVGVHPQAGFVGNGSTIISVRPTKQKVNWATRKVDGPVISGSMMNSVIGPQLTNYNPSSIAISTSSYYIESSISMGRGYERQKLNAILLARPKSAIGRAAYPSTKTVDYYPDTTGQGGRNEYSPTGSFESPSWTHASIGKNTAFVQEIFSSSFRRETVTNNYFYSGTQAVENSPVPASASLFYSKNQRFQTITVKHTASALDIVVPTVGGIPVSGVFVPTTFVAASGVLVTIVTGTNGSRISSPQSPASIFVSVPVTGRLVDIRIWVELIHTSGSGKFFPLGNLGLSIRSPSVRWGGIAHPMMNDPQVFPLLPGALFRESSGEIVDFYRDSFLLWEGGNLFANDTGPDSGTVNNGSIPGMQGGTDTQRYPTWQKDRGMRTIFHDGASIANPRMLYTKTSPSGNFNGAPNASSLVAANSAYGCNVPWTSEGPVTAPYSLSGSPPQGWLNGAASTADVNEWPTTGVNYGANTLRPIYPLLDPLYGKKIITSETAWGGSSFIDTTLFRGNRPGLRGSEISGTWQFLICTAQNVAQNIYGTSGSMDCYFRQIRLEITYESSVASRPANIRNSFLANNPRRSGETYMYTMSGSSNLGGPDYFQNQIYTVSPGNSSIGRTFGLKLINSATLLGDNALGYKLSGALATIFGPNPSWLLDAQTGMPYIPMSSASLSPPSVSASINSLPPDQFINPRAILDTQRKLEDAVSDTNPQKRLVDLAVEFVSASSI